MRPTDFYYAVSGEEAVRLLLEYGEDGEFLARPSSSSQNSYTLSIRCPGARVTHVKVVSGGDCLQLAGGGHEAFASLAELVNHYIEHPDQLRQQDGQIIRLTRCVSIPPHELAGSVEQRPIAERWFHSALNGSDAESLLKRSGARVGTFLVRDSLSSPGSNSISVMLTDGVRHVKIDRNPRTGRLHVGGGDEFNSVGELVAHHQIHPIVDGQGNVIRLTYGMPATRTAANRIAERLQRLEQTNSVSGKTFLTEEFERLQQADCNELGSRREGKREANVAKNRYKNIIPYDETRVRLLSGGSSANGATSDGSSDYINANYLRLPEQSEGELDGYTCNYITCQGCLPHTVDDFWRMIVQQRVECIAMMTREIERGQNKCFRYWPDTVGATTKFGTIRVRLLDEQMNDSYTVRKLIVDCDEERCHARIVWQLQLTCWPDHGCPADPVVVLDFLDHVRLVRQQSCTPEAGPPIMHCSAGIGRTGTIVVIDILVHYVNTFNSSAPVDIAQLVWALREQRSGLVQTEAQYRFIYEALAAHVARALRQRKTTNSASSSAPTTPTALFASSQLSEGSSSVPRSPLHSHPPSAVYLPQQPPPLMPRRRQPDLPPPSS